MKRVALILIPIFLLLSIFVTVYIVVTQRLELRKKAVEVAQVPASPTPTEAPTPTPTKVPQTPTPTATSMPTPNQLPVCTGLSASPTSGTAPLTVNFVGSGTDPDGPIQKFEFTYGDGEVQTIEKDVGTTGSVEIAHTYTASGIFVASLRIQDNNGVWSSPNDKCSVTITTTPIDRAVGGTAPTATYTPTPTESPASPSATPASPDVPVAGGILQTIAVSLGGLLILSLGLLFAL